MLIGLSGGSDSVALVFLLRELAENGGFSVAGVAHLNHQLRPRRGATRRFAANWPIGSTSESWWKALTSKGMPAVEICR